MAPGEQVAVLKESGQWSKKTVNPEAASAWRNHKWILEEVPLQQVAAMIEDAYGLKVTFTGEALKSRKVSGVIPTNDVKMLLDALSLTLSVQIDQQADQVIIRE